MLNDRIERALDAIHASTSRIEARAILEELYDAAQNDLWDSLCSAEDAAQAWNVGPRRARAHIARLNQRYAVGAQIGGSWIVRQADVERYPPDAKYRVK